MEKMTDLHGRLLEGCIWDECSEKLYFVDIECRKIYCFRPDCESLNQMELPDYVSDLVLKKDGTLIAALPDGLYHVDFDKRTADKVMESCLPDGIRYNDGKCDPKGRLWLGSMAMAQDESAPHAGALFCIEKDQIKTIYSGFTIPNGLAWDTKKALFYHVDTATDKVDRYRMTEDGQITEKRTAIDLKKEKGSPDGMCMDSEGHLWIAMWGGYQVICADPTTGEVLERIPVPDANVSCCCFGGKSKAQLYITTARDDNGDGGELYVEEIQVTGGEVYRYGD